MPMAAELVLLVATAPPGEPEPEAMTELVGQNLYDRKAVTMMQGPVSEALLYYYKQIFKA